MASNTSPPSDIEARIDGLAQLKLGENHYQYQPLQPGQIRIVGILPGGTGQKIEVIIFPFSLEEESSEIFSALEALSYVWGIPTPAGEVFCQGKTISVTPNLYDALQALRTPNQYRLLWIDQICINQRDNEEKSSQVQLMHRIYSMSRYTLVWLSKAVFEANQLPDSLNQLLKLFWELTDLGPEGLTAEACRQLIDAIPSQTWEAISVIFSCSYFTRIWMIQEVVMGKECWIMAAGGRFKWEFLERVNALLAMRHQLPIPASLRNSTRCFTKMVTLRRRLTSDRGSSIWLQTPRWSLLDLLRKTWVYNATDKRDKIYALVGLLELKDHCIPQSVRIDYTSGTTHKDLIRGVFIHGLTREGCLESLLSCHPDLPDFLPSWIYDCNDPHANVMAYELGFTSVKYRASKDILADVQEVPHEPSALSFKVTKIGRIKNLAAPSPSCRSFQARVEASDRDFSVGISFNPSDLVTMLKQYFNLIFDGAIEEKFSGISPNDFVEFCRAICCDINFSGGRFSSVDTENARHTTSLLQATHGQPLAPNTAETEVDQLVKLLVHTADAESPDISPQIHPVLSRINDLVFGRACLFDKRSDGHENTSGSFSSSDAPCWVPLGADINDILVIVHGFRMPMLLRKQPGDKERYRFLGISYVHGFMDGEALDTDSFSSLHMIIC